MKKKLMTDFKRNYPLYLLIIPVVTYYIMFCYIPIAGNIIAFKDYAPRIGVFNSPWAGFRHFERFFASPYFGRILKNTLTISLSTLFFSFPMPIILALLINEIRSKPFKKFVQTTSYLPHFVSLVVICSMITEFTNYKGIFNDVAVFLGFERQVMLNNQSLFLPIYIISDIWQSAGWGSIVYLAALAGIDQQLYEAATIDGANQFQKIRHVTIPGMIPTIVTMLILRIGGIMNVGFEKIILIYNPVTYDVADVISSYVYRVGMLDRNYSFAAVAGLFNAVINAFLLFSANKICKRVTDSSLF